MVNKKFWLGILAIVLVFGMSVVGCDNGTPNDELDGTTWRANYTHGTIFVATFNSPNFTLTASGGPNPGTVNGTYSISGNIVTLTAPHLITGNISSRTATLSGNTLITISDDGTTPIIFTKQ